MKNAASLQPNNSNSSKTPGGISKSLLTPCRRLGLSRNWRKNGPSPFISPLAGSVDIKEEKLETRKRKERVLDNNVDKTPESSTDDNLTKHNQNVDIDRTPSRNVELPQRKKSKILLSAISKSQEVTNDKPVENNKVGQKDELKERTDVLDNASIENIEVVSTPVRSKSKKSKKKSPASKSTLRVTKFNLEQKINVCSDVEINTSVQDTKEYADTTYSIKEKSPNDLSKECIVVIQRKIFKKSQGIDMEGCGSKNWKDKKEKLPSQTFNSDSDSDELPLLHLNHKDSIKPKTETLSGQDQSTNENGNDKLQDDDFIDKSKKKVKAKVRKSPKNKQNSNKIAKTLVENVKVESELSSQSTFDDEDDDFDNKKTILIRKTYEKVSKPLKSKSTGSITHKDIAEIKARIEAKKKLLLAKSITSDTEELRNLIKKWQKGCQNALMELLDLMKTKFHDKQHMDYSEMLQTLKIPPSLVGYDEENDCFISPDDATIILGPYKDI